MSRCVWSWYKINVRAGHVFAFLQNVEVIVWNDIRAMLTILQYNKLEIWKLEISLARLTNDSSITTVPGSIFRNKEWSNLYKGKSWPYSVYSWFTVAQIDTSANKHCVVQQPCWILRLQLANLSRQISILHLIFLTGNLEISTLKS